MDKEPVLGGQAVIEGVMMKSPNHYSVAVRKPDKTISIKVEKFKSLTKKHKVLSYPILRGVITLFEMLVLGMKALTYSANESGESEDEKLSWFELTATITIAMLFTVGLFIVLPFYLSKLVTSNEGFWFNLIDGIIRIIIFIIYIFLISLMKDIRRVFQYHGAEHMTIHCMENKKPLTVNNVKKYSTLHNRCGTSFIIIVLVVSILIFSLLISDAWYVKLLGRIILIPIIAGLSYELLKLSAKHNKNICLKLLIWPGLMLQKITTRKPTSNQLEVAIAALKAVAKKEGIKV